MAMIPLQHDLKEFLKLLSDHHVDYLLIGGYAVTYHGYPRSTVDMDVWIEVSPENGFRKLIAVLQAFGFGETQRQPRPVSVARPDHAYGESTPSNRNP